MQSAEDSTDTDTKRVTEMAPEVPDLNRQARPTIVVLCGSTRFKDLFERVNRMQTLRGRIVLAPGVFPYADGTVLNDGLKAELDELHLRKIDLADEVVVVSDEKRYLDDSTLREIEYALSLGKPVRYYPSQA